MFLCHNGDGKESYEIAKQIQDDIFKVGHAIDTLNKESERELKFHTTLFHATERAKQNLELRMATFTNTYGVNKNIFEQPFMEYFTRSRYDQIRKWCKIFSKSEK